MLLFEYSYGPTVDIINISSCSKCDFFSIFSIVTSLVLPLYSSKLNIYKYMYTLQLCNPGYNITHCVEYTAHKEHASR